MTVSGTCQVVNNCQSNGEKKPHFPILKESQGLEQGILTHCEVGLQLSYPCICFKILSELHK